MFTVFVLGNIASGKSTACRYFESRGAMLIDLDELAKSLYVPGSDIVNTLADEFGWDILDEEGGIPAQHGAEADGVAAAIFFDFDLRDLLVFFVARGNGDKPVDRRIFGIRKGEKAGAAVGNAVDGVFVFHQLVIRKINVILVGKKIKLCVRHKEPPINGEPRLSTRLREHFCPDHLAAAYRGAAVFVIPTIYQPHIGERTLF